MLLNKVLKMGLAEKMLCKTGPNNICLPGTDCSHRWNEGFLERLFDSDWEVFVIERNKENGRLDWYTICCDAAKPYGNAYSPPCC